MQRRFRLAAATAAAAASLVLGGLGLATPAHASVTSPAVHAVKALPAKALASSVCNCQWEADGGGGYMDAWDGGPYVNIYNSSNSNNDFTDWNSPANSAYSWWQGVGGKCLADYGNSSSNARAGLVACSVSNIPWGANLTAYSCSESGAWGYELYDSHWGGWVTPNSGTTGAPIYLNSATATCWVARTAA